MHGQASHRLVLRLHREREDAAAAAAAASRRIEFLAEREPGSAVDSHTKEDTPSTVLQRELDRALSESDELRKQLKLLQRG